MTALHPAVLTGAGGPVEASRIAWRRARSFNLLSGNRAAAGVLLAPWLWPIDLLTVAISAPRIRRQGGASMTLYDGQRTRPDPRILMMALVAVTSYFAVLYAVAEVLPIRNAELASGIGLLVAFGPILVQLAYLLVKVARTPELRTLNRRRTELARLTGHPTLVMSSFVRSTQRGEGRQLLTDLRAEWASSPTTVILNPANRALADYYIDNGAVVDGPSWRRLLLTAVSSPGMAA
jgi:hypothetical protein